MERLHGSQRIRSWRMEQLLSVQVPPLSAVLQIDPTMANGSANEDAGCCGLGAGPAGTSRPQPNNVVGARRHNRGIYRRFSDRDWPLAVASRALQSMPTVQNPS